MEKKLETATLGGGCFWCVEAIFEQLKGVERTVSGYAGGDVPNPTYHQVCTGTTGHAEVVQITFDPEVIPYRDLIEIFLTTHDPTTPNRQGADVGPQYRSIILYHNDEQRRIAHEVIAEIEKEGIWSKPIVTEVVPLTTFYPAEDYHQDYYRDNPSQPYCFIVIEPKLAKFREKYAERLKEGMEMEG
jgi:peptide-methionine (S)-S-oxide reductase